MATVGSNLTLSMTANVDLSAYQYHAVVAASVANSVDLAKSASNRAPFGILMNSPSAGQEAEVLVIGKGKLACNGGTAIGAGEYLIIDASAKGITTTSASVFCATALAAVASGCAIIDVWWQNSGYYIADNTP